MEQNQRAGDESSENKDENKEKKENWTDERCVFAVTLLRHLANICVDS
jgi:hypothetical protein